MSAVFKSERPAEAVRAAWQGARAVGCRVTAREGD